MSANMAQLASFTRDLADVVAFELKRHLTITDKQAGELGLTCAQKACDEFAGQLIYVPMNIALRISERDRALYALYVSNGRNINATAKEFDCSVQTAYKRVRMIETAEFNARQGALFAGDETDS